MRFKIYNKTIDKLSSLGVKQDKIVDPFAELVLTSNEI